MEKVKQAFSGGIKPERWPDARTEGVRKVLVRVLQALSGEAMAYVWRPMVCAYAFTGYNDPEFLTNEDVLRYNFIEKAIRYNPEVLDRLDTTAREIWDLERKAVKIEAKP